MTIAAAARALRAAGFTTRHVSGHATAYRWTGRNHLRVDITPDRYGRRIVRAFRTGARARVVDWETAQTLHEIVDLAVEWAHNVDLVHAQFAFVLSDACPPFTPDPAMLAELGWAA